MPNCLQVLRQPDEHLKVWSGIIFLIACAIRVTFVFESSAIASIRTPTPGMDVDLYWQAARLIGQGACGDRPCFELMMCSSALHPYWLAFWQMLIGREMILHRLVNACLVSFSAVLMLYLIFKLTNRFWPALVCALAWSTLPSLIFFDTSLYKTSLAILFLNVLIVIILYEPRTRSNQLLIFKGLLTGILLSFLMLLQSATFLFFIVVSAYYILDRRLGRKNKQLLIFCTIGSFALILLGFHSRDAWSNHRYPRYLPQNGIHFRIGFNARADGSYVKLKQIPAWPYGHNFQARMVAEVALGRPLTPAEADRYFIHQAVGYIIDHPLDALGLVFRKTMLFFNNYEVKGVDDLYYLIKRSRILSSFRIFGTGIMVVFASLGVIFLLESRQYRLMLLLGGILGAVLVSNLIIFISWRYRLFNLVPLVLLASFGLVSLQTKTRDLITGSDALKRRLIRHMTTVLLPMLAAGIAAYYPLIGAKDGRFFRQAEANELLSNTAEGLIEKLHRVERRASDHPRDLLERGLLLKQLHRHSEAYELFKHICERTIEDPTADYNYLRYLMWLGEYEKAAELIRRVKSQNPHLFPNILSRFRGVEKEAFKKFVG